MARINKYFNTVEFVCRCGCGQVIAEPELIRQLTEIREFYGKPVILSCVNRCEKHNMFIGGVEDSQHIRGKAADFRVKDVFMSQLHKDMKNFYRSNKIRNLGLYSWGCHIDIREDRRFWDNRLKS
jgi:uncharacterized protein YcbK (DUF882 family)